MRRGLKMLEIDETELKLLLEKRKNLLMAQTLRNLGKLFQEYRLQ